MTTVTRDQFLAATAPTTERVAVPEIGDDAEIIIAEMSAIAKERYEDLIFDKQGKLVADKSLRAILVAMTAVDDDGEPLFTKADVDELGKRAGGVVARLYAVALRINKMRPQDLRDTAKNS